MIVLISGKSGSGKSRFAEQMAVTFDGPRYYIATMVPATEENRKRIEKHRLQRQGMDFYTIEEPYKLSQTAIFSDSVVLLEDVSNFLANLMFGSKKTPQDALAEILMLHKSCKVLLAVTISGLSARDYAGETASYIEGLDWLNSRLLEAADAVVEMEDRRPVCRKGILTNEF